MDQLMSCGGREKKCLPAFSGGGRGKGGVHFVTSATLVLRENLHPFLGSHRRIGAFPPLLLTPKWMHGDGKPCATIPSLDNGAEKGFSSLAWLNMHLRM